MNSEICALFLVAAALLVGGCAVEQARTPTLTVYDPAETAHIHESGPNEVRGQAFLTQRGGDVVTCASQPVLLIPASTYAKERVRNIYGTIDEPARAIRLVDDPDARYLKDQRITVCDAQGNFVFSSLPDGEYFVATRVTWEAPSAYYSGLTTQGGPVMAPVQLSGGETKRIIISP